MDYLYEISLVTENALHVLQWLLGQLTKHLIKIKKLDGLEKNKNGLSQFNITMYGEEHAIIHVIKKLQSHFDVQDLKIIVQKPIEINIEEAIKKEKNE